MSITPVYVGDLPVKMVNGQVTSGIDEAFLRDLFSEYGKIVEGDQAIRIISREDRNGNPYSFAFINFQTYEDALNAVRELNYTKLDGCPIRLGIADKETRRIRQSGQGNLFIKNLDKEIEVSQLHDAFANFGEIISCKIPTDENGKSRGYGYVQFRKPEEAEQAMSDLREASINGRPITIEHFQKRQRQNPENTYTNVYIKNLPSSIASNKELYALFAQYGEIDSCFLQLDENNASRGVGFCSMKTHDEAVAAVKGLDGKELEGLVLVCNRSMSRQERLKFLKEQTAKFRRATYQQHEGRNLYIKNFDESATEDSLRKIFEKYGPLESIKIMRDENGESKKFGYVCFVNKADCQKCIDESALLKYEERQLYVARHKARDDRIREQTYIHNQRLNNQQHQKAMEQMNTNINPAPMNTPFPMNPPFPNPQFPNPQFINQPPLPLNNMPEFASVDPKTYLRQSIIELKGPQASIYLTRLRDMSDQQAQELYNNKEDLFRQWLEIP